MSVEKLRYWCHKVLPLVYDESLSYYEVLCKLTKTLNEVIDEVDQLENHLEEVVEAIVSVELENYVTNNSLNTTLANYVTNTSLSATLDDYATKSWVNTQIETAIGAAIAASY